MRDLFTEDFAKLVIEGEDAWKTVSAYVESVAPDLAERVQRFERGATAGDIFATYRVDEQIQKGLDRKVWLPSGGSLIIDRTEAMTVVDVNTGKFTGSGGNLEETVTKNNLEAAEEIVRQLRLRDIGGIIVVDFIDMVLESNRDLVVRRLVECLGRDRTRHQVAEVTSLGLVQMTRKRIGTGLLESFSENCEHCHGRGVVIKDQPGRPGRAGDDEPSARSRPGRGADATAARQRQRVGGGSDQQSTPRRRRTSPPWRVTRRPTRPPAPTDARGRRGVAVPTARQADRATGRPEVPHGRQPAEDGSRRGSRRGGGPTAARAAVPPAGDGSQASPESRPPRPRTVSDGRRRTRVEAAAADDAPAAASVEPGAADVSSTLPPTGEPRDRPTDGRRRSAARPGRVAAEPAPSPPSGSAPERPRVVTRTRRRAASRPAGPPSGVAGTAARARAGSSPAPPTSSRRQPARPTRRPSGRRVRPGLRPLVEHVPIKKKGSRKR